jgi:hypothetical protein
VDSVLIELCGGFDGEGPKFGNEEIEKFVAKGYE